MALSASRPPERRDGKTKQHGVLASVQCYKGGIAMLVGGYLRPGRVGQGADNTAKAADAATYRVVGVFTKDVLGGGTDGAATGEIENDGWYKFKNSTSTDACTEADVESPCYVIDDETVGKLNTNSLRTKAGIIKKVSSDGVWVRLGYAAS